MRVWFVLFVGRSVSARDFDQSDAPDAPAAPPGPSRVFLAARVPRSPLRPASLHELIQVLREREQVSGSRDGISTDWGDFDNRYLVPSAGLVELNRLELRKGEFVAPVMGAIMGGAAVAGAAGAATTSPEPTTTMEPTTTPLPEYEIQYECFPGDSMVLLANGGEVLMRDLKPGDVLAVSRDFVTVDAEPWVFDFHFRQDAETVHEYLEIVHEEGVLKISPTHFLFRAPGEFVLADAVKKGDALYAHSKGGLRPSTVKSVGKVLGQGMYAPVTRSGRLIVDGALVSSFAVPQYAVDPVREHPQAQLEGVINAIIAPFRPLCNLWPESCAATAARFFGSDAGSSFGKGVVHLLDGVL